MFANRCILVTGATSGIGFATSSLLLARGANVVAIGRNRDRLAQLERIRPGGVTPICFDLTQFEQYSQLVAEVPPLDGLVYSAGVVENNPLRFFSHEKYQRTVAINQTAPLALIAALARTNKLEEGSSLVLISSILGTSIGMKGNAAYAGTKAALVGYAKVMALELAHKQIRINCVSPGMVRTELLDGQQQLSDEMIRSDEERYPLGKRYARADEVAAVIHFLLSQESSFITGQNLIVDGGFTAQ